MEIRFNPLILAEADAVRRFLTPGDVQARIDSILKHTYDAAEVVGTAANGVGCEVTSVPAVIAFADRPDVGAEAPSDIPLPPAVPAPSGAAVDLFPTAPVVPSAGIPMPPGAALPPVPPVPAQPPAPPAPAAATSPAAGADLDKDGLPWDGRIHSESKAKVADGSWRKRRGTPPELVAQVEAQLRALMAVPSPLAPAVGAPAIAPAVTASVTTAAPTSNVPAPPVSAVPLPPQSPAVGATAPTPAVPSTVPPPPIPSPPSVSTPAAPAVAPAPTGAIPPATTATAPANAGEPITFASVMREVTDGLRTGKFTEARVQEVFTQVTKSPTFNLGMLAARLDLLGEFSRILAAK